MPATEQSPAAAKHQRGTNVRQRQAQVGVRLTAQEYAAVKAAADRDGSSTASVLRNAFFGNVETAH